MRRLRYALCVASLAVCSCGGSNHDSSADLSSQIDAALPSTLQGCSAADYVDHTTDTGAVAVTPWDLSSYAPRCIKIRVGQTVTWASSSAHPLIAMGGTSPSPIPTNAQMTPQSIVFSGVGTYGFWCNVHTKLMEGAIQVVAQ